MKAAVAITGYMTCEWECQASREVCLQTPACSSSQHSGEIRDINNTQHAGKQSCDKVLCRLLSTILKESALFLDAASNLYNWDRLKRSNVPNTLTLVHSKIVSTWKENIL